MIPQTSLCGISPISVLTAKFFGVLEGEKVIGNGDAVPLVLEALTAPLQVVERIDFGFETPPRQKLKLFHEVCFLRELPFEATSYRRLGTDLLGHFEAIFQDTALSDEEIISRYFDQCLILLREGAKLFLEKLPHVSWKSLGSLEQLLYESHSSNRTDHRFWELRHHAASMAKYGMKRRSAALLDGLICEAQAIQDEREQQRAFAVIADGLLPAGLDKVDLYGLLERWLCAKLGIIPHEAKRHIHTLAKTVSSLEAIAGSYREGNWLTLLFLAQELETPC